MSIALTDGTSPTAFLAGDMAIWGMCIPTDVTTPSQFSAQAITATGATFGTAVEFIEPDSTTGNDIGGYLAYATVTSGSSTTAPTVTTTLAGTLTNVRGPVVLLRIRETQAYTLDAQPGPFSVTGQDATLTYVRNLALDAQPGSFTVTGQDATLTYVQAAKELIADAGSFTITGQNATVTATRALSADAGLFAITGQDATLTYVRRLTLSADAGSFAIIGQNAELLVDQPNHVMNAEAGSFIIAGQSAELIKITPNRTLGADAGSFIITGQDADLTYVTVKTLIAEPGSFTFDPPYVDPGYVQDIYTVSTDARLIRGRVFIAEAGSFTITGYEAHLLLGVGATISYTSRRRLAEIYARLELDSEFPVVITPESLTVGTIAQTLSPNGSTRSGEFMDITELSDDLIILEIWQRLGLDANNPLAQTPGSISAGGITCTVDQVGSTVTVARQ